MRQSSVLAFVIIALATGFLYFVPVSCSAHLLVCLGDASAPPLAPGIYRLLPSMIERLVAPAVDPYSGRMLLIDALLHIGIVTFTVPLLYAWLKRWVSPDRALIGLLLFAVIYLMAYHLYFRSIGTSLEILFVCWALVWLDRRWVWLVPIAVLAALNRETGVLIAGLYFAYHGRSQWRGAAILATIWAVITAAIHLIVGSAPHVLGVIGTLLYNLDNFSDAIMVNLLFIPLAVALLPNYRHTSALFKRLTMLSVAYMIAVAGGGAWNETQRLLLPALPILMPLLLASVPVPAAVELTHLKQVTEY